ncbi:hypothetical protein [Roseibium aggregatum]|uniref:Na+/proline symporter n=1 Tax=Roseibium aggregatum TaxID=187304 RepID=A0A939EFW0_9HYPH|nr:hypothetical protein [Roseibium aggregatum]MBN9672154.1 hypothetical protein [Roseibium aggregatum]
MHDPRFGSMLAIAIVLLLPLLASLAVQRRFRGDDPIGAFVSNKGGNGFLATAAGAICGNIGIGTFVALFLFASQSPVIGFSIAASYALGLILCALMAPLIRRRAAAVGAIGLIDLIARSHETRGNWLTWLPIAVVFILRSAVQLSALGVIAASLFAGQTALATIVCAAVLTGYLLVGGYRAAVTTDILQSAIILGAVAVAALGLPQLSGASVDFLQIEPFQPTILIGIWLLLPWSAVLAVDNWQRVTVASSDRVAVASYLGAAVVCGACYAMISLAGYWSGGGSVFDTFSGLMPPGAAWSATAMFTACIMSSIDTFVMPLTVALGDRRLSALRWIILCLMVLVTMTALAFGDVLSNVIAAFNSLTVFLPAALGALYLKRKTRWGAVASMCSGLVVALCLTLVDINIAALLGFVVATVVYGASVVVANRKQQAGC